LFCHTCLYRLCLSGEPAALLPNWLHPEAWVPEVSNAGWAPGGAVLLYARLYGD
jgi:hypothetical protein